MFLLFLFIYSPSANTPYRMNKYTDIIAIDDGNVKEFSDLKYNFLLAFVMKKG